MEFFESDLDEQSLPIREKYWIEHEGTLIPNGLNILPGGQIGGYSGKKTVYAGKEYPSIAAATDALVKATGLPKHIVATRIRNDEPLPETPRSQSNHPEAGTNLWRRWKSLINATKNGRREGEVEPDWLNYDNFAADVRPGYREELRLVRLDITKPWGRENFKWVDRQEAVDVTHGKACTVEGKSFSSLTAAAHAYGISVSTLKYRVFELGMRIDDAVSQPLGPTSKSSNKALVIVDGLNFDTTNRAAKYAAPQYGLTVDQARDRLRRNIPLDRPVQTRGR